MEDNLTIMITVGNGSVFGLNDRNDLIVCDRKGVHRVNLGPLTQARAMELSEYLQRLSIHTPER